MIIFLTRPVCAAISWTVLAEVVRRHGRDGDLRIIETPTGGDPGDRLTLVRVGPAHGSGNPPLQELGSISLEKGMLKGSATTGEGLELVEAWLQHGNASEVVALAEQEFGLPPRAAKAPTNRWTFGPRALAALLGSQLERETYLEARMCPSAPCVGNSAVIARPAGVPAIAARPLGGANYAALEKAAPYWALEGGADRKPIGMFRSDGFLSSAKRPDRVHDLFRIYREKRSLPDVVGAAIGILEL